MRTYYVAGIPYSDTELNHMGVSDVQWDKSDELYHYGIKGQQWGKRRFVDYDGKLTSAGRRRYGIEEFQPAALKDNAGTQNGTKQSSLKETIKRQQAAGNQYGTRFSSAQRKNHIESPVGNPNRPAVNAANAAAARKADMKATVAYNNSIPGRINAGINAGKEWLNQAGQNINNAASDAVNYVTGNQDYNDAMAKANNYQQQAINAGGDTKTIGDVGPNVEANNALNNAEQTMKNAENQQPGFLRDITNVGNWIGDRARDAGNWVGDNLGIYNAANWVGDRARDAGNWVGDRASDVANYFTGNRDNATYNRAMEGASRLANQPGGFNAARDLEQYANSIGYQQPAFLRDVTNVGNWIGDRARDAGNWVGDNLGIYNAANWVGDRASDVGNWVGDRASDVGNWLTGDRDYNIYRNAADHVHYDPQRYEAYMNAAQNARDNSVFGRIGNAANTVGDWIGQNTQNAANWLTGYRDAAPYEQQMNALRNQPGAYDAYAGYRDAAARERGESALGRVGQGIADAWNWTGNAANTAGNWIGQNAQNASNWIGQNAQKAYTDIRSTPTPIPAVNESNFTWMSNQAENYRQQARQAFESGDNDRARELNAQADEMDRRLDEFARDVNRNK